MEVVIGIGEYAVSKTETDTIKTYALSSCVAVVVYNPVRKAAGMIHVALPYATSREDLLTKPAYYADSGIPLLIHAMCGRYGCRKEELVIQLFGGADSLQENDLFGIGRKNLEAVVNTLNSLDLRIASADVGGTIIRTVAIRVGTGDVSIETQKIRI